jgi:hypothetical protein
MPQAIIGEGRQRHKGEADIRLASIGMTASPKPGIPPPVSCRRPADGAPDKAAEPGLLSTGSAAASAPSRLHSEPSRRRHIITTTISLKSGSNRREQTRSDRPTVPSSHRAPFLHTAVAVPGRSAPHLCPLTTGAASCGVMASPARMRAASVLSLSAPGIFVASYLTYTYAFPPLTPPCGNGLLSAQRERPRNSNTINTRNRNPWILGGDGVSGVCRPAGAVCRTVIGPRFAVEGAQNRAGTADGDNNERWCAISGIAALTAWPSSCLRRNLNRGSTLGLGSKPLSSSCPGLSTPPTPSGLCAAAPAPHGV